MTARRGWAVILVSVIALTLVWRFLPAGSPPIYDGQCIANPYETLGGTPAPAKATKTFPKAATFPPAEVLHERGAAAGADPDRRRAPSTTRRP